MDEIPPIRKSRIISRFKKGRDEHEKFHGPDPHDNETGEGNSEAAGDGGSGTEDERARHRKWYRKNPARLLKFFKNHVVKVKKAFFIDRKV